ncbi:MAG: hypothetical protein MUO38_00035 [Anaerolineales bacterium]|nr:hypothetical protein [Anaerolineales bacterium]
MTPQRGKGCVPVLHSAHPSALALVVVLALALGACGPAGWGDLGPQLLQDSGIGCVRHPGMEHLFCGTSAGRNPPT